MQTVFKAAAVAMMLTPGLASQASTLFINELHYDNAGFDKGEGVELAGTAGTDLSGYELLFYNGSNGSVYESVLLSGNIADQQDGFGAIFFDVVGLQNGAPDGVALVDPAGFVLQFLSYEGSFIAQSGAAAGLVSDDIGLAEDGSGMLGSSLQLVGLGTSYQDFAWIVGDLNSYGQLNGGQTFASPVPAPAALPLFAAALGGLGMLFSRARCGQAER